MIHAFCFTCDRDNDLCELMVRTLYTHCKNIVRLRVFNTDHNPDLKEYGNGAGWGASMLKLNELRKLAVGIPDDDYIMSVDSDVVFGSPEIFNHVHSYGIIGTRHRPEYYTHFGPWGHMSGALIFFRGDVAKRMAALSLDDLDRIRYAHFKGYRLTENEDVVLSYLARYVDANYFDIGNIPGLSSNNFESDVLKFDFSQGAERLASFYHLNYCPKLFMDEPVAGKWDIPKVLNRKKIEL